MPFDDFSKFHDLLSKPSVVAYHHSRSDQVNSVDESYSWFTLPGTSAIPTPRMSEEAMSTTAWYFKRRCVASFFPWERTSLNRMSEFIIASLELAYEYAKLGRLKRAIVVFSTALEIVRSGETSPEIGAFFLLRFAETLALVNDVPRRYAITDCTLNCL